MGEPLRLKVQGEADNRNPNTSPRLCLPNRPLSITPICHFYYFLTRYCYLIFQFKIYPWVRVPFLFWIKKLYSS